MTKAALEAMNGLNLFGMQGSSLSVIHVDPDAQYRNRVILNNLLPRESSSKETDASLLCITGYPAFAIDDSSLCELTEKKTCEILEVRTYIGLDPTVYNGVMSRAHNKKLSGHLHCLSVSHTVPLSNTILTKYEQDKICQNWPEKCLVSGCHYEPCMICGYQTLWLPTACLLLDKVNTSINQVCTFSVVVYFEHRTF